MTDDEMRAMIREELSQLTQSNSVGVEEAVRIAVTTTLITLGMDASNPLALQQDMAFIRELRDTSEKIKSRGLLVLIGIMITGLAATIWLGMKASLGHG
tara:strand:- start:3242 stop:3538 length:297 start_codon:yes stop_codon:yes gene_type:complete